MKTTTHPTQAQEANNTPRLQVLKGRKHGAPCPATGTSNGSWQALKPTLIAKFGDPCPGIDGWQLLPQQASTGAWLYGWFDSKPGEQRSAAARPVAVSSPGQTAPTCADLETRNRAYTALFDLCPLSRNHKMHVAKRGFSAVQLRDLGWTGDPYKNLASLPHYTHRPQLATQVRQRSRLTAEQLLTVPGFVLHKGRLSVAGRTGLLLPIVDNHGNIHAVQVRPDDPGNGGKYTFLTSSGHGGPKAPQAVGLLVGTSGTAYVTEGYFKAVALRLADPKASVFYLPGVHAVKALIAALDACPHAELRLCLDADMLSNPNVYRAAGALAEQLHTRTPLFEVLTWSKDKGKGIDDYLLAGHSLRDLTRVPVADLLRGTSVQPRQKYAVRSPSVTVADLPTWRPGSSASRPTTEQARAEATKQARAALHRGKANLTVLTNSTGAGKSHAILTNARPGTLLVYDSYKDLEEKAAQLRQLRPNHTVQVLYGRQAQPEQDDHERVHRWQQAGCADYTNASDRATKGYSACMGCPLWQPDPAKKSSCTYTQHERAITASPPDYLLMLSATFATSPRIPQLLAANDGTTPRYHTVVFDDVPDLWHKIARPHSLTREQLQAWTQHSYSASATPSIGWTWEQVADLRNLVDLLSHAIDAPEHLTQLTEQAKEPARALLEWLHTEPGEAEAALEPESEPEPEPKQLNMLRTRSAWETAPDSDDGNTKPEPEPTATKPRRRSFPWQRKDANIGLVSGLARSLLEALLRGDSMTVAETTDGDDIERKRLHWVAPNTTLLQALDRHTLVATDSTADLALWRWFADLAGCEFSAPTCQRVTPNIVQVADLLWTAEQCDPNGSYGELVRAEVQRIETDDGALVTHKRNPLTETDASIDYWGSGAGRGVNTLADRRELTLLGHYCKPTTACDLEAWQIEALAERMDSAAPLVSVSETRRYGDPWRPWEREYAGTATTPLAEHLRRHDYTAAALQYAARVGGLRGETTTVYFYSGEPLDGLSYSVPVTVTTTNERMAELGLEPRLNRRGENLAATNQRRAIDADLRAAEVQSVADDLALHLGRIPTWTELRERLPNRAERCYKRAIANLRAFDHAWDTRSLNSTSTTVRPTPSQRPPEPPDPLEPQGLERFCGPENSTPGDLTAQLLHWCAEFMQLNDTAPTFDDALEEFGFSVTEALFESLTG